VVDGDTVDVTVTGPGVAPPASSLAAALDAALGRGVSLRLETIPSTVEEIAP